MVPQYEPVRQEILNPQNRLAAGSGIPLGLTEEQRDDQMQIDLEQRRIVAANFKAEDLKNKVYKKKEKLKVPAHIK